MSAPGGVGRENDRPGLHGQAMIGNLAADGLKRGGAAMAQDPYQGAAHHQADPGQVPKQEHQIRLKMGGAGQRRKPRPSP